MRANATNCDKTLQHIFRRTYTELESEWKNKSGVNERSSQKRPNERGTAAGIKILVKFVIYYDQTYKLKYNENICYSIPA